MLVALREFQLAGISHTIPFHLAVLEHPEFIAGNLTTHFLPEYLPRLARTRSGQELDDRGGSRGGTQSRRRTTGDGRNQRGTTLENGGALTSARVLSTRA